MTCKLVWLFVIGFLCSISLTGGQVTQQTIWELISKHPNMTKFAQLIQDAELTDFLNDASFCKTGTNCLTVLAPNNWAVDVVLPDLKWSSQNIMNKKSILRSFVVQYSEPIHTNNWMNYGKNMNLINIGFGTGSSLDTLEPKQRFAFQGKPIGTQTSYFINNAVIVQPDLVASNGVVHVTSEMLYSPKDANSMTTFLSESADLRISGELWNRLMDHPQYQPFIRQQADNQPLFATYFVVTDDGWRSVPHRHLEQLKKNITLLASVLAHHYCHNQLVFDHWLRTYSVIDMHTGFPKDPLNPDPSQLNTASLRRSLDGTVTLRSASFQGIVNQGSVLIKNAIVHTISSPIGFVYRNAETIINAINGDMLAACKADADCNALLTSGGKLTYFVPNRDTFGAFLQLPASQKTVYLKFMVLKGEILQDQMTDIRRIPINGLEDGMRFRHFGGSVFVEGRLANQGYVSSRIVKGDQEATDGVVHQIDRVIALPAETVEEFLARSPEFSDFKSYTFVENMKFGGPYTYFVPTNTALRAMMHDVNVGKKLLSDSSRRGFIFRRHSYPMSLLISDLSPSKRYLLSTANYAFTREELSMSIAVPNNNNKEAVLTWMAKSIRVSTGNGEYQFTNGIVYTTDVLLYTEDDLTVDMCTSQGC